ncbi:4-hydroxybenzoate octaprenyltransferase [Paludibacterium yongneupense]|uniref:4-hydroxybenzoate octaprenyltransferase n=1 Tax=Paludibacterium yongneupense TaxID=400061 RepID=UPI000686818F
MRIDKPIGTLLLLWPTYWGLWIAARGHPPLAIVAIFTIGTFLTRSAGCVVNDYADRHFDARVERTRNRPFARGAVGKREALLLAAGLTLLAGLLILPLNRLTLQLSAVAVLIAVVYPFTKRFFPLPQAWLGLAFAFGIPMGFAAVLDTLPPIAWILLLATAFWTIAYDTAYAMADKPDDIKIGLHTSAITFGRFDAQAVMLCHALFLGLMSVVGSMSGRGAVYYLGLAAAALLIGKQYLDIRGRDRALCFKAFLDNNRVGWVIFLALAADYALKG